MNEQMTDFSSDDTLMDVPQMPARHMFVPESNFLPESSNDLDQMIAVAKAVGSPQRLRILDCLAHRTLNVSEISAVLEMPLATVNMHLNKLEEAKLIRTEMVSARRGQQRMCARIVDTVIFHLPSQQDLGGRESIKVTMPVGAFVDHAVVPTCGMLSADGLIGQMDDPITFYEPERSSAQLVWFTQGHVEYRFPYRLQPGAQPSGLQLSLELCSEAVPHHLEWPSDIFLEINGVNIGTWTSPSDFGGVRGRLTPEWWRDHNSQYGLLKTWRVDREGAFIDGRPLSGVTIGALKLADHLAVSVRIGVKATAANVGGINIFGQQFGNHAQDIILELFY